MANEMGSDSVGIYSVAYQVSSIMLLVGTSINQAWSVSLFKLLGDGAIRNRKSIRQLMVAMIGLLMISFIIIFSIQSYLFKILIGNGFAESQQYFPFLLLSFLFQSIYFIFVNFDFYEERVIIIGITTLGVAIVNVAMNLILIPEFGINGSAYAALTSMALYMITVVLRVVFLNKSFRMVWII
ncbi:hypothetical protein HXX01_05210 [Candidatus Nomurabacteria bacterium]|nr:hypothetical protein [Candidatus Nomurabacteria bacterium]